MRAYLITPDGSLYRVLEHDGNERVAIGVGYSLLTETYLQEQAKLLNLDTIEDVLTWLGIEHKPSQQR